MAENPEVAHLRELMDEKFKALAKANDLAYLELQRRLDVLNHAHENMVRDRADFLPIDTHNRFYAEFTTWKDEMNKAISNIQGRGTATIVIIGFVFALLQLAIRFWK
jgi:hypothetical protein